MKHCVATITKGNQEVQVLNVDGLTGYEFGFVGAISLPLAVELAVLQTQKGIGVIDELIQTQRNRPPKGVPE